MKLRLFLVAGAIGVAAAVRHLWRNRAACLPADLEETVVPPVRAGREDYFCIRRTQSELGYVYWVLQGHGQFRCFELYDTWREACDEAVSRAFVPVLVDGSLALAATA